MSETEARKVKCAPCKCALQGPKNPKPDDRICCPQCGVGDTFDAVMREVGEYVKEQAALALNDSVRDAARGSKFVKITTNRRSEGGHRFII